MYSELIKLLQNYTYHSELRTVVAGGALRDIDHGLRPKDIDLFVLLEPDRYGLEPDQFQNAIDIYLEDFVSLNMYDDFRERNLRIVRQQDNVPEEYRENLGGSAFRVVDYALYSGEAYQIMIQLIFYDPTRIPGYEPVNSLGEAGRQILKSFDLSTSMIFSYPQPNGNGFDNNFTYKVVKHPSYKLSKETKVIFPGSVNPTEKTRQRMFNHSHKLRYGQAICDENETPEQFRDRLILLGEQHQRNLIERELAEVTARQRAAMNQTAFVNQFAQLNAAHMPAWVNNAAGLWGNRI